MSNSILVMDSEAASVTAADVVKAAAETASATAAIAVEVAKTASKVASDLAILVASDATKTELYRTATNRRIDELDAKLLDNRDLALSIRGQVIAGNVDTAEVLAIVRATKVGGKIIAWVCGVAASLAIIIGSVFHFK